MKDNIYGPGEDNYGRDKFLSPIPEHEMDVIIAQAKKNVLSEPNRRNRLDLNTPAELAIYNAMVEVEKCGASESLTKAVTLLQDAKNALADHIEGFPPSEEKKEIKPPIEGEKSESSFTCNKCGFTCNSLETFAWHKTRHPK